MYVKFEPKIALNGGIDGFSEIKKVITQNIFFDQKKWR